MLSQPQVLAFQVFSTSFVFTAFSQSFHGFLTASPRKMFFIKHTQRLISKADKNEKEAYYEKDHPRHYLHHFDHNLPDRCHAPDWPECAQRAACLCRRSSNDVITLIPSSTE
jgi:hypothetical protein